MRLVLHGTQTYLRMMAAHQEVSPIEGLDSYTNVRDSQANTLYSVNKSFVVGEERRF